MSFAEMNSIGILGGGQLAKMISLAALNLGFKTHIYAESAQEPAMQACTSGTIGKFIDQQVLESFAKKVDFLTIETENIPIETLNWASAHTKCHIQSNVLQIVQDRFKEKTFLQNLGLPTVNFALIEDKKQLKTFFDKFESPIVLKTLRFGYDGKGQQVISNLEEDPSLKPPFIAECFVHYQQEASVVCACSYDRKVEFFPVSDNTHEEGILRAAKVPSSIASKQQAMIQDYARRIINALDFVGLMTVECFIDHQENVLINELAPRPHNSAHWSLNACNISQFEQLVRIISGLPMKQVKLLAPCTMQNLLGEDIQNWIHYSKEPNCHPMVYGKQEIIKNRKMGHVNILGKEKNSPF